MSGAVERGAEYSPARVVLPAELDSATAVPFAAEVAEALGARPESLAIDCSGLAFATAPASRRP